MFRAVSLEQVARRYPGFDRPLFLHNLQAHIVESVVEPRLERHLPEGGVAVDLGCGSGTTVRRMARRARTAVGVDIDPAGFPRYPELEIVPRDVAGLQERTGGFLVQTPLDDVPLPSGSVDFVTSRWVFEHLQDPASAVREIRRLLKPGGIALIIVPNRLHPGILASSLLPLGVKQWALRATSGVEDELVMPTFYRVNTGRALRRTFEQSGFETLEIVHVADPSYWLFSRSLFGLATALGRIASRARLERFRMHIVGVFRAPGPDSF